MPDLSTLAAGLAPLNAKLPGAPLRATDWNLLVETVLALVARDLGDLPARLDALAVRVDGLEAAPDLGDLPARLDTLSARVDTLEGASGGGGTPDNPALLARLTAAEQALAALAARVDALPPPVVAVDPTSRVEALEGQVETLSKAVATLQAAEVAPDTSTALGDRVTKLEARADDADARITALGAADEGLDRRVDELEGWRTAVERRLKELGDGAGTGSVADGMGRLTVAIDERFARVDSVVADLRRGFEAVDGGWRPDLLALDAKVADVSRAATVAEERARAAAGGVESLATVRFPALEAAVASNRAVAEASAKGVDALGAVLNEATNVARRDAEVFNATIESLGRAVAELPRRVSAAESAAAQATTAAQAVAARVTTLASDLTASSAVAASERASLRSALDEQAGAVAKLDQRITSTGELLTAQSATISALDSRLAVTATELATTMTSVTALSSPVSSASLSLSELSRTLDTTRTSLSTLSTTVSRLPR